jgi:HSP20 family protein
MASIPKESLERLVFLRREIDRIFREFFDPQRSEAMENGGHLEVALDMFETPEEFVIEAELPGVQKSEIELSVLRDIIIIEGTKAKRKVTGKCNYHCMERNAGNFRRIIEIPGAGDTRAIKAEFDRGLLRLRLPKINDRRGSRCTVPIE